MGTTKAANWTLEIDPQEAATRIEAALADLGAEKITVTPPLITAETARSLRQNRWAARWEIQIGVSDDVTVCRVAVDMAGTKHDELIGRLAAQLADVRGTDPASPPPVDDPRRSRTSDAAAVPTATAAEASPVDRDQIGEWDDAPPAAETDPVAARVQQLAQDKLSSKFMVRRELKELPTILHEGEELHNLAQGKYQGKQGLVVVTDRRVMFVEHGMMRSRLEDFPYKRISSVQSQGGVMMGGLTIYASGNTANISDVAPKERAHEIGEFVRAKLHAGEESSPPQAPRSPPAEPDPLEQLKKLGDLLEAGILTPEEFADKKRQLLDRM